MFGRLFRFGSVGTFCTLLHVALMHYMTYVVGPIPANAAGFLVSSQVNFLLSYRFTWRDSERKAGKQLVATWLQFDLVVVAAVLLNSLAFVVARHLLPGPDEIAVVAAAAVSTAGTFFANHFFVLRPEGRPHDSGHRNGTVSSRLERG